MIAIIDYGAGNIQSVRNALRHIGADCAVSDSAQEILQADGFILPGVGAFGDAMKSLEDKNLSGTVREAALSGKPFLGICAGMQLLFEESEESPGVRGLGLMRGKSVRLAGGGLKVPHMGWNSLEIKRGGKLLKGTEEGAFAYFVHSYCVLSECESSVTARTAYGMTFDSAVEQGNMFGVQFHPEKSGGEGLAILRRFVSLTGEAV